MLTKHMQIVMDAYGVHPDLTLINLTPALTSPKGLAVMRGSSIHTWIHLMECINALRQGLVTCAA